jgi:putative ABC transport system permease protein
LQDSFVYVPIETFLKIYGSNRSLSINIQCRNTDWMARTQEEARVLMRARRHLRPNEEDSFGIFSSAALMDLWNRLTGAIAKSMVGVVSVFLVIGGIVIMNIMLASVTERTREIGVRKAIGARRSDIIWQFLTEAMTLTGAGGVVGVSFGVGISLAINAHLPSLPSAVPLWAIVLGVLMATSVGLFFGMYPAVTAARLDPVEGLRYE